MQKIKTLLLIIVAILLFFVGYNMNAVETAVNPEWEAAVDFMDYNGLSTTAQSVSNYDPMGSVKREAAAKLFVNYSTNIVGLEEDDTKECSFVDINEAEEEFRNYIISSCKLGILKGTEDGKFLPKEELKKHQFLTVLARIAEGNADIEPEEAFKMMKDAEITNADSYNDTIRKVSRIELALLFHRTVEGREVCSKIEVKDGDYWDYNVNNYVCKQIPPLFEEDDDADDEDDDLKDLLGGLFGGDDDDDYDSAANYSPEVADEDTIGFNVGGEQDIMLFRENIKNGYVPDTDIITYNGIYSDYHFSKPEGECEDMFCPLLAASSIENYENGEEEYRMQIGLGSNIKQSEYNKLPTNFVFVIDISGSMSAKLDEYYYYRNNPDIFDDDSYLCEGLVYFEPARVCIAEEEKINYQKEYENSVKKNKMDLAMEAMAKMVDKLQPEDRIGVVLFDDKAYVAHEIIGVSDINTEKLKQHLLNVGEMGGTNMEAGMKAGMNLYTDDILSGSGYQNRLVFITDAMPNLGDTSTYGLSSYVKNGVEKDIYFTFMGVGVDFKQDFIDNISQYKGANYFFIDSGYAFYQRFVDEFDYSFFPMVFDVKMTIDNPELVEEVYGLDVDLTSDDELIKINTLFPTPKRVGGKYRGSIILLKLKEKPESDIAFDVTYETYTHEFKEVNASLLATDFEESNDTITKGVTLTWYVDALKTAINYNENSTYTDWELNTEKKCLLDEIRDVFLSNQSIFSGDNQTMYTYELATIDKLKKLLPNLDCSVEEVVDDTDDEEIQVGSGTTVDFGTGNDVGTGDVN